MTDSPDPTSPRLNALDVKLYRTLVVLKGYAPGRALMQHFSMDGANDLAQETCFEAEYRGLLPAEMGNRIDALLLDWMEGRAGPPGLTDRMNAVLTDLGKLRETIADPLDKEVVNFCIGSLEQIRDENFPSRQAAILARDVAQAGRVHAEFPPSPRNSPRGR